MYYKWGVRMIYCISDIHGQYDKYCEMIEKINFSQDDTLYVIGDVVDRGEGGIKVLQDMMYRENVIPMIGNHEYMAYSLLPKLNTEIREETLSVLNDNFMESLLNWQMNGGNCTITEFGKLSTDDREEILDYLSEFSLYETVEVNGNKFILVHAGIDNYDVNRDLDDYSIEELIFNRCNYDIKYFDKIFLVTGHTPTFLIDEDYRGKIYQKNNHIAIDTGCCYGEKLACICLNTFEEFYV